MVAAALTVGAGVLASELFGVAERCLEMTVAYVKERHQFARPVGSFQALKHRLADVWIAVTQARAAARYAAACLATGDPRHAGRGGPGQGGLPATRPCTPRRSACSCTAASASPGNTRRTCC